MQYKFYKSQLSSTENIVLPSPKPWFSDTRGSPLPGRGWIGRWMDV